MKQQEVKCVMNCTYNALSYYCQYPIASDSELLPGQPQIMFSEVFLLSLLEETSEGKESFRIKVA